jgi:hypothetical protein
MNSPAYLYVHTLSMTSTPAARMSNMYHVFQFARINLPLPPRGRLSLFTELPRRRVLGNCQEHGSSES